MTGAPGRGTDRSASPGRAGTAVDPREASVDKGWRDIPIGGVIPAPGTARGFETGDWRTDRPVLDLNKCIHCMRCWVWCPDVAILTESERVTGIDFEHCKGCGICAEVCPPKVSAIRMVKESEEARKENQ
ncbi:MAG: 4Fe-4S binding protein [Firmicutes bacterium]|nr:4Fe-4S binding protein [Bacillota bacterium]